MTFRADGLLQSGDSVLLKNNFTNGVLVANPLEKCVSSDAYAVTTNPHNYGATARSVFTICHAEACGDAHIRFGQTVHFATNSCLMDREMYLNSLPLTPMTYSRYSRNQEVSVYHRKAHNTVWRVQPSSGVRQDRHGECVKAGEPILLEHVATSQYLANDKVNYQTFFGAEFEVSCMALATKAKTQILFNESQGSQVRENVHKQVCDANSWQICLASDPSEAESVPAARKTTPEQIISMIK